MKVITMASIFKNIGYFLSAVAFVAVVSGVSISNYKATADRQKMLQSDSTLIREVSKLNTKVNTIEVDIKEIKATQIVQTEAQNALRSSYVQHLRDNKALTTDEFLKYMEGIQFELKKNSRETSMYQIPSNLVTPNLR